MKRILFSAILIIIFECIANAQIRVVEDNYLDSLSAVKKCYEKDLVFDSLFQRINFKEKYKKIYAWTNGKEYRGMHGYDYSLIGDTLFIPNDIDLSPSLNNGGINLSFSLKYTDSVVSYEKTVPSGYYVITGYVFCNGGTLREKYTGESNELPAHSHHLSLRWMTDERRLKEVKECFLENENELKLNGISSCLEYDYVILTSISEPKHVFYCRGLNERKRLMNSGESNLFKFFNVVFYNEFKRYFIGKKVGILKYTEYDDYRLASYADWSIKYFIRDNEFKYEHVFITPGDLFTDAYKKEKIKILDSLFTVKDLVIKGEEVYCVLEGENTGSFAIIPISIRYSSSVMKNWNDWCFELDHFSKPYCLAYPNIDKKTSNRPVFEYFILINLEDYNSIKNEIEKRCQMIVKQNEEARQRLKLEEDKKQKQQKLEREQRQAQEHADFRQRMINKYGNVDGNLIANQQVTIGMTTDMCKDAWGQPMNTYRTTTKYGQSEVWCYNYKTRIYFFEGKVVQIDN